MKTKPHPDQFEFDGVFEHGPGRQNMTVQEVARGLGCKEQHVRDLIDQGVFVAPAINDNPNIQRRHCRIARFSVVAYWREQVLASEGCEPPFPQTRAVLAWRNKLRADRNQTPLPE